MIQKFNGESGKVWVNSANVTKVVDNAGANTCTVHFVNGSTEVLTHQPSYVARKLNETSA